MRLFPAISVVLSIVSFVLVMIAINAGRSPGYMEEYHVLYFNTSTLGENLLDDVGLKARTAAPMPEITAPPNLLRRYHGNYEKRFDLGDVTSAVGEGASAVTSAANEAVSAASSAVDTVESAVSSALSEVKDALEEIADDLADKLAETLGIQEWYSVHLLDMCYGDFTPKTTAPNATFNVTNCTTPFDYTVINITEMLDQDLSVGPFSINLADLGITQDIQSGFDGIASILRAIVGMYIIAAAGIGASLLGSTASIFLLPQPPRSVDPKWVVLANFLFAGTGMFFLLIGNLVTSVGGNKIVEYVNEKAGKYGLYAYSGTKFAAVAWASFALMVLATLYWVFEFFAYRHALKRHPEHFTPKMSHSENSSAYGDKRPNVSDDEMDEVPLSANRIPPGFGRRF